MSCNIRIPLQQIIDDVSAALSDGFIKTDNAVLNEAVLNEVTIRGDISVDTAARNALCAILQTCGITAIELEWLDRPTVADMVAVSSLVGGEIVVTWQDLDALIAAGIVGKVSASDVSVAGGGSQEDKNTEFRNELDALPFEEGILADTFVTATGASAGVNAVARTQEDKNSDIVSVRDFGATGSYSGDDTTAFVNAFAYCAATKKTLHIPRGNYVIKQTLPMPTEFSVLGMGWASTIYFDLPAGSFGFDAGDASIRRCRIDNLNFDKASGASADIGVFKFKHTARGMEISNIWSTGLRRFIDAKGNIYGTFSLQNIFINYLGYELDEDVDNIGIDIKGNTVFMNNIEVIGRYHTGLKFSGAVFCLKGFNIGGGAGNFPSLRSVVIDSARVGTIQDGWSEGLSFVYWGSVNGKAEAFRFNDCKAVTMHNVNVAAGSVYINNSELHLSSINYGQNLGGVSLENEAYVVSDSKSIGRYGALDTQGETKLTDATNNAQNTLPNPFLDASLISFYKAKNTSLTTLSSENTDFITGSRSLKSTSPTSSQGLKITLPNLTNGATYTFAVWAKVVSGIEKLNLVVFGSAGTLLNSTLPMRRDIAKKGEWRKLHFTFEHSGTTSSADIELVGTKDATGVDCVFLIDSMGLYAGYSEADPRIATYRELSNNGLLVSNALPTIKNVPLGTVVKNSFAITQDVKEWVLISIVDDVYTWKEIKFYAEPEPEPDPEPEPEV